MGKCFVYYIQFSIPGVFKLFDANDDPTVGDLKYKRQLYIFMYKEKSVILQRHVSKVNWFSYCHCTKANYYKIISNIKNI